MKSVKFILLVSLILGLVIFQVKFVTENDNLNMKADIGISKQANAEINPGGIYKEHQSLVYCGSVLVETWSYTDWVDGYLEVVGSTIKINGEYQQIYSGEWAFEEYRTSSEQVQGYDVTCEGGNRSCTPGNCIAFPKD
jgi:hypothetical protein